MLLVPPSEAPVCVFFQGLSNTVVLCSSESSKLSDPASTLLLSVLFNRWRGGEEAEKAACSSTPKHSPPANLDISMPVFPKKSMVLLVLKGKQVLACFTEPDLSSPEEVCLFFPWILPQSDILVLT